MRLNELSFMYMNMYNMCMNCRLLTPLSDTAAEILGVEKRKYLVYGKTLYKLMLDNGKGKYSGYNNVIYNYLSIKCVSYEERNFKKITVNGIDLYEGKLKVIQTLPFPKPEGVDTYEELFEGEIKWGEQKNKQVSYYNKQ